MKYDIKEIKNFLIDELTERKGKNTDFYLSELTDDITEYINYNGAVSSCTSDAIEFIKDNFDFIGNVVEYYKDNLDMIINPFLEPDKCEVLAYICGVGSLVSQSEVLKQADEESKYNEFTLTDDIIDKFIEELENLEIKL